LTALGGRILDESALLGWMTASSMYLTALVEVCVAETVPLLVPAASAVDAYGGADASGKLALVSLLTLDVVAIPRPGTGEVLDACQLIDAGPPAGARAGHILAAYESAHRGWPVVTNRPDLYRNLPGVILDLF
jgi:hypothetical protein